LLSPTVLRGDIERALDDLVSHEEGMRFQSLAVILGKLRWPDLIASERRWDQGRDAYVSARMATDGRGKALAVSVTATLAKLKADAAEILKHVDDVSLLVFVTPEAVSNHTIEGWTREIREAYGYDLVVIQREEIVSELLKPQSAILCRSLLGLQVPIQVSVADRMERARVACASDVAAWSAHPRLAGRPRIGLRAIRLDDRGEETTESVDLSALRSLLGQGRRMILEAPAGRGKTTTLVELATAQGTRDAKALSFLVDVPIWLRSRQPILPYLASTRSFLAEQISAGDLAELSQFAQYSFLLNGWNEIPERYSEDAGNALRDLERAFPAGGIIIATRTHHVMPALPGASRLKLLPLTRAQRRAYLNAALEGQAEAFATNLDQDEVLDELTRTPLILAEVVTLFRAGKPIPGTKAGILAAVTSLMEAAVEHRAQLQGPPLNGNARDFLMAMAVAMTKSGAMTLSESDARRLVSSVSVSLRDAGQIAILSEPMSILAALTAHHVLERVDYPSPSVRFEHQQFQEFFAASLLARTLLETALTDSTARRRFGYEYVNVPRWEETLVLVAELLGDPNIFSERAQALKANQVLAEGALEVDAVFAARLARRSGGALWEVVREAFGERFRRLYESGEPHFRRCALAAVLATGTSDFTDMVVPLLTHSDRQVRLQAYGSGEELQVSSLGSDWRRLVDEWAEECRVDFVMHLPAEVAEDFARDDTSRVVRAAAVERLSWLGADFSFARVLEAMNDDGLKDLLSRRLGLGIPEACHRRAREMYRVMLGETKDVGQRLRILVAAAQVGGTEAITHMQEALVKLPSGRVAEEVIHPLRAALGEISRVDPQWGNDWVAEHVLSGDLRGGEWAVFTTLLSSVQREELLRVSVTGDRSKAHIAREMLVRTGNADLAGRAFRMLCELQRPPKVDEASREAAWNLLGVLGDLPAHVTAAGVVRSLSGVFDEKEYATVVDVFSGTHAGAGYIGGDFGGEDRQALRGYLKSGVERVLREDDFSGMRKMHLAAALARVGDPEDVSELSRLIQADLARLQVGLAARRAGEHSERAQGAVMRCSNWYVSALVTLDPTRAEGILLDLLLEPEYEDDAAAALVRLAAPRREDKGRLFQRIDYDAVWKARQGNDVEGFDQSRRARYVVAFKDRIEALLEAAAAGSEGDLYNARLKRLAARLAIIGGASSGGLVLDIMARTGKFDEWLRLEAVEGLLVGGGQLSMDAVLRVLQPVIDYGMGNRHDQQAFGLLRRCVCLLPLVDPAVSGVRLVRELLPAMSLHGYDLAAVVRALGNSRCAEALAVLLEIVSRAGGTLSGFAGDWVDALVALGTSESERVLLSAIDPEVGVPVVPALFEYDLRTAVVTAIARIVRQRADVMRRILELCERPLSSAHRDVLADVIAALGEREVVLRGLSLVHDRVSPSVPTGIQRAVQDAAVDHRPVGGNTYYLVPASVNEIRRRLFDLVVSDSTRRRSALALLGQIEESRLEYGRPSDEPRHPDIESGVPWPPIGISGGAGVG